MIKKGIITSAFAVLILIGFAIEVYNNGLTVVSAIAGFTALGFFATKDFNQSHSKNVLTSNPPPTSDYIGGELPPDDDLESPA